MTSLRYFTRSSPSSQAAGVKNPMQVDVHPEKNDNNEEEICEVDFGSFNLEAYATNYVGLIRIYRLIYIADHYPKLRLDALRLAISYYVITTLNVKLYYVLHNKLLQCQRYVLPDVTGGKPMDTELPVFNASWMETTTKKAAMKLKKLEGDLKSPKITSVKERIRKSHKNVGDHYINCGDLIEAIKRYSEARDYCTNNYHVMSMYLNVIKVGIYLEKWDHVANHITVAASLPVNSEKSELRTTYCSTLKCMTGLADLARGYYKPAAHNFLQANLEYWDSIDVMTPNDIAIYGGLCALATFNRSELLKNVIYNHSFKLFLELEPEIRVAFFKFYNSKYEVSFTILDKIKSIRSADLKIWHCISMLVLPQLTKHPNERAEIVENVNGSTVQ